MLTALILTTVTLTIPLLLVVKGKKGAMLLFVPHFRGRSDFESEEGIVQTSLYTGDCDVSSFVVLS